MKTVFVRDLDNAPSGTIVTLLGWVQARRDHGGVTFLDIVDSTGMIQVVVDRSVLENVLPSPKSVVPECAVQVVGKMETRKQRQRVTKEVLCEQLSLIAPVNLQLSPQPRSAKPTLDETSVDEALRRRHLYIRNPRTIAVMKFRHAVMRFAREWFEANRFIEFTAPILTPLPLYDDKTAISVTVHDESVFLTQCVGFYLEAAAQGLERVYNMGPSFRNEESRSKRHLMEYWHIKGEMAFADLEDAISLVESIISKITERCSVECTDLILALGTQLCTDGLHPPYPRITYRDAVARLQAAGREFAFGKSLASDDEEFLAKSFTTPFWIVGIPRSIEPFPYVIDPSDPEVTRTADLIATRGYGELLGIAEKISDVSQLVERMKEKNRADDPRYEWVREVHAVGCVPHIGFGMGLERLLRWLLLIDHVRDVIPFPRSFRRNIYP